jgi:hypothetical protein
MVSLVRRCGSSQRSLDATSGIKMYSIIYFFDCITFHRGYACYS